MTNVLDPKAIYKIARTLRVKTNNQSDDVILIMKIEPEMGHGQPA